MRVLLLCCVVGAALAWHQPTAPLQTCEDTVHTITSGHTEISPVTSLVTLYTHIFVYKDINITSTIMQPSTVIVTSRMTDFPDLVTVTATNSLTSTVFVASNDTISDTQFVTRTCNIMMTNIHVGFVYWSKTRTSTLTTTNTDTKQLTETLYRTRICTSTDYKTLRGTSRVPEFVTVTTPVISRIYVTTTTFHYRTVEVTTTLLTSIETESTYCPTETSKFDIKQHLESKVQDFSEKLSELKDIHIAEKQHFHSKVQDFNEHVSEIGDAILDLKKKHLAHKHKAFFNHVP